MIRSAKAFFLVTSLGCVCFAQSQSATANPPANNEAGAYYNFAMGRLYTELAGTYGNRSDYVSKAIEHYQAALKLDPSADMILEELTDLYIQSGRLRDAVTEAQDLIKQNPDNLQAHRMLGRIYTRMIGDTQQGRINEEMLRRATEQYQQITQKDPSDAESWVILGRLDRVANDSPGAENAFNQALKADPKNGDALVGLAMMYMDQGDSKRAIDKLKSATDQNPDEQTLAALAKAYRDTRDYKDAAETMKRALAIDPSDDRLQRMLAEDLLASNQYDDALKIYQGLASDDPQDAESLFRMAEIYRVRREFDKAQDALTKAKAADPDNLDIRDEEVKLLEAQGKDKEAITALKSLLTDTERKTYSPAQTANRAMFLQELGALYRNAGQYQQAVDTFRQISVLDSDSSPRVSVMIIDTYRAAKDYDNAKREADAAVQKYPQDRMVHLAHASLLADMGNIDQAATEVRGLLDGKNDVQTQLALAEVYEKGKRFTDMGKALDDAAKLSPSKDDEETIHFMRGAMHERLKKYDAAEAEFRKVLEIDPDNAGAMNYLGYMLADRDVRLDEAYGLIKKALDLDPQNGAYMDSLGWVYFRQDKLNEAEDLLVRALEREQDPTVHDHLGDVYLKLGKTKDAINQWQASLKGFQTADQSDKDPEEVARIMKKLENARVRLAKETKQP
ncbi:MAG TPA: tetratricopeptide repeat protein [Bryobacteraceae bacterium]|nr:tetratricopeptide repeat protein [Bryobacteraceae bacterium]